MHHMKKVANKSFLIGSTVCFTVLFCILLFVIQSSQGCVFTAGSREISTEEVSFYLNQQKNATYLYFSSHYDADNFDDSFWSTSFSGVYPLDYAKQRAIENCYAQNIGFILAEQALGGSYTFESIKDSYIQYKTDRSNAVASNAVFFGPESLEFTEYYSYYLSNLKNEVIEKYRTGNRISEASIEFYYNAMKNTVFSTGATLDFWVVSTTPAESANSENVIGAASAEILKNGISPTVLNSEPWNLEVDEYILNEHSGSGIQATASTFLPLIDGLTSGDISDISYDANLGYFFVYVSSREEGRVFELDEVHNRVETILLELAYEEDYQIIREQNPIIINEKQLKKVSF